MFEHKHVPLESGLMTSAIAGFYNMPLLSPPLYTYVSPLIAVAIGYRLVVKPAVSNLLYTR
jgi:hypothetical protein